MISHCEVTCEHCGEINLVDNGDPMDVTSFDIEGFQCRFSTEDRLIPVCKQEDAELLSYLDDFIQERGLWCELLDFLKDRGYNSEQIADAFNALSGVAGRVADLKPEDC